MAISLNKMILAAALAAAALFPLRASDGRIPVSAVPYTITAPGHYYLTRDLTVASGIAITISSSRVTLDLNGFTLTNSATAFGNYGVFSSGFSELHIHHGTVVGGTYGVTVSGLSGGTYALDHLVVHGQNTDPNSSGISLSPASGTLIAVIEHNRVYNVSGSGMIIGAMSGGRVEWNTIVGCTGIGLYLTNSNYNSVRNNQVSGVGGTGAIYLSGGSGNNIGHNTTGGSSMGVRLYQSSNNTLEYNTASGNSSYGIALFSTSNNNLYAYNRTRGNGSAGIYIDPAATGNTNGGGNF